MPKSKVTSRIAAITGKLAVALAALLAPAILIAETISVTFDAALTNETGWVYDTGFEYVSTQKKYGFKSGNNNLDQIISPVFDFAVTSVVINAEKASNKTTRKMSIRATLVMQPITQSNLWTALYLPIKSASRSRISGINPTRCIRFLFSQQAAAGTFTSQVP